MTQTRRISRNNTQIYTADNGTREVFLHNTCILTARPDGSVTLRTGGWLTVTTVTRMNQAANEWGLNFSVSRAGGMLRARIYSPGHNYATVAEYGTQGDELTFNPRELIANFNPN